MLATTNVDAKLLSRLANAASEAEPLALAGKVTRVSDCFYHRHGGVVCNNRRRFRLRRRRPLRRRIAS